ncbi:D-amino-acid dehydrogenase [Prauserella shujinwangii]|uniref:D-amino-acid dehydrogenase n=1 Tax=Prauserella shujinwangii TaxID=1453103 RepID=A0A2T0LX76_9PSEU|nr:D-amino-acid dehydrogenase [Prauserella shujinwangii]
MLVVGAGLVGLCTAWHLRARGVEVTVLDRHRAGTGASWGNAGWLSPAFAVPLPEPATVRAGLKGFASPSAPLYVPARPDPRLARFLATFALRSTHRRWRAAMAALVPLNLRALAEHDALAAETGAVSLPMEPCLVAAGSEAQREAVVTELEHVRAAGQPVDVAPVDGRRVRELWPSLSERIACGLAVHGQRYVDPGGYVTAVADAARRAGVRIEEGTEVTAVRERGDGVRVHAGGAEFGADAVVLASGALLNRLARPFGVRRLVQAGRGYSFSVVPERMPPGPVYFPARKVVCTPLGDRLRVAGMMEFRSADAPLDPRRVASIVAAVRPLVAGVDWAARTDEWVGARPVTSDGLPLIGPTLSPRVFVAGGHGMWGVTHGPVTGRLLADTIVTGTPAPELAALHPLR